ncbi:DNA topoisomerase I, mitochondrial isoform X2 [Dermochelys coriacea]|uniref:DNA topoisomerase I, mitochondrial isoform X2 n=1 Tax=Dermochelys coriacea TaxID=27794 RepID=UPI001CA86726|nr:DNA topoisomerase I, mitochondrial isoform X2 [Dermochelys coriacea]
MIDNEELAEERDIGNHRETDQTASSSVKTKNDSNRIFLPFLRKRKNVSEQKGQEQEKKPRAEALNSQWEEAQRKDQPPALKEKTRHPRSKEKPLQENVISRSSLKQEEAAENEASSQKLEEKSKVPEEEKAKHRQVETESIPTKTPASGQASAPRSEHAPKKVRTGPEGKLLVTGDRDLVPRHQGTKTNGFGDENVAFSGELDGSAEEVDIIAKGRTKEEEGEKNTEREPGSFIPEGQRGEKRVKDRKRKREEEKERGRREQKETELRKKEIREQEKHELKESKGGMSKKEKPKKESASGERKDEEKRDGSEPSKAKREKGITEAISGKGEGPKEMGRQAGHPRLERAKEFKQMKSEDNAEGLDEGAGDRREKEKRGSETAGEVENRANTGEDEIQTERGENRMEERERAEGEEKPAQRPARAADDEEKREGKDTEGEKKNVKANKEVKAGKNQKEKRQEKREEKIKEAKNKREKREGEKNKESEEKTGRKKTQKDKTVEDEQEMEKAIDKQEGRHEKETEKRDDVEEERKRENKRMKDEKEIKEEEENEQEGEGWERNERMGSEQEMEENSIREEKEDEMEKDEMRETKEKQGNETNQAKKKNKERKAKDKNKGTEEKGRKSKEKAKEVENEGGSRKRKSKEEGDKKKNKKLKKEEDEKEKKKEENKWKWWEEEKTDDGVKWKQLEHKGPYFAPLYEPLPDDVKFYYDGKPMKLNVATEEIATFYAKMLDHEYTTKEIFQNNFFHDWRKEMTSEERKKIKHLEKCDFKEMHKYFVDKNEARKALSKEEKQKLKEEADKIQEEYGYCILDGHREKIGNFKTEPPGLFRGRGDHPKMGMLKKRIMPEDVIINCSKDSQTPKPPSGHKWKEVRCDNTVTWLASWTENIQNSIKYIMLNPSSKLKGEKDWQKYEVARRLKGVVDKIRSQYRADWKSREMKKRQRSVALYFIDKLALRAGNEKEEGETADTVGCCSLRIEHIKLHPELDGQEHVVEFDFLGKDSIRYYNKVPVEKPVFKNLQLFMENKDPGDDLFDRLNTTVLNKHLQDLMDGLTAKVFRTYNASITLQEQLKALTNAEDNVAAKLLSYNRANRAVAILCNHQRATPKSFEKSMQNLQAKIDAKKDQLAEAQIELKRAKADLKAKKDVKSKATVEKKKKLLEKIQEQLLKLNVQATDKEENKQIALGTSKLNYLDPRISVAWCKKFGVPIEKIYNKTQREKFAWAIDMADEDFEF